MRYQVLARKWRPRSFDTLVGQPHVVKALSNALEQNRLHHAYLLTGTRGVGKTTMARILAKSLNCETGISKQACDNCPACQEIDQGRFVDLIEIDAASNTGVDAMRELLENAQYAPSKGRFKVYIIDEVHMLSTSAFNAMLKTLEEPPEHIKFILATTDPQKVPVTVLSRCIQFNLRQMSSSDIVAHLQTVLAEEKIAYDIEALGLIARAAQGSMRDALSLTDQAIAYGEQTIKITDVSTMLGAIDQSYLFKILDALIEEDGQLAIAQADAMQERSLSFETALDSFSQLLHHIAMLQTVPNSLADDFPERQTLLTFTKRIPADLLQLYYQISILAKRDLSLAPDEYAGFTMCLLRMLTFAPQHKLAQTTQTNTTAEKKTLARDTLNQSSHNTKQNASEDKAKISHSGNQPVPNQTASDVTAQNNDNNTTQSIRFDGNWRGLIKQLKLGTTRTLAQNCEVSHYDEHSISLFVQAEQKHLLMQNSKDKLSAMIAEHFKQKIQLNFDVGGSGDTPAKQIKTEKAVQQSQAEESIHNDTFVQALMQDFDASIVKHSIKPIE